MEDLKMKTREEAKRDIIHELFKGSRRVMLTGQGGVGKSHMVSQLREEYSPIVLSTTGVSAILVGGVTVHSFFKLGISSNVDELMINDKRAGSNTTHKVNSMIRAILTTTSFIVIDEVSMMSSDMFDMVLYRLKGAKMMEKPLLLTGDFLQLPPVSGEMIIHHPSFEDFKVVNLNTIHRTTDTVFMDVLNKSRKGIVDDSVYEFLESKHKAKVSSPVRLVATNREAEEINSIKLSKLEQELHSSIPIIIKEGKFGFDAFLKDAKVARPLYIKEKARVMITRNMKLDNVRVVNGDVGTVVDLHTDEQGNVWKVSVYVARLDKIVNIDRVTFEKLKYSDKDVEVIHSVRALPLILAWAITIHKSQGSSIASLKIDTRNIFAQSQFYVALSRSSDPSKLSLLYDDGEAGFVSLCSKIIDVSEDGKMFYDGLGEDCQYE